MLRQYGSKAIKWVGRELMQSLIGKLMVAVIGLLLLVWVSKFFQFLLSLAILALIAVLAFKALKWWKREETDAAAQAPSETHPNTAEAEAVKTDEGAAMGPSPTGEQVASTAAEAAGAERRFVTPLDRMEGRIQYLESKIDRLLSED